MADMLHDGLVWLTGMLKAKAGRPVAYSFGGQSVTVQATVGRTLMKLDDGMGGVRMVWTDRDYLVPAADLILGGLAVLPQRGAQMREVVGSQTQVYEVMTPGQEPEWRWSDPHQTMLRIHVKRTG